MPIKGPIKRRAPGQRLRRQRRNQEIEQLRESDPVAYDELVYLRSTAPQAFKKRLSKLIKNGTIKKGRGLQLHPDELALLEGETAAVVEAIAEASLREKAIAGLLVEEDIWQKRPEVLRALRDKLEGLGTEQHIKPIPRVSEDYRPPSSALRRLQPGVKRESDG